MAYTRYRNQPMVFLGRQPIKPIDIGSQLTQARLKTRDLEQPALEAANRPAGQYREIEAAVSEFEADVRAGRATVPGNPAQPTKVYFTGLAAQLNVNKKLLANKKLPYRGRIEALVSEFGLQTPLVYRTGPLDIEEFQYALEFEAKYLHKLSHLDDKKLEKRLKDIAGAFETLTPTYASDRTAPAKDAVGAAIADPTLSEAIRAEFQSALAALEDFGAEGLPKNFTAAVHIVCNRFPVGGIVIANAIGVSASCLWQWRSGRLFPTPKKKPAINELESLAGLAPDILWNRCFSSTREEPTLRGGNGEKKPVAPSFAFPADWPLVRDAATGRQIYRKPSAWPRRLASERDAFMHLRSDLNVPHGMNREGEIWKPDTQSLRDTEAGRLFGFMTTGFAPFEPVPEDSLTMVLLASTVFVHAYISHRSGLRDLREQLERPRLTRNDLAIYQMARGLFKEDVGFLFQRPDLADRLEPVRMKEGEATEWAVSPDDKALAKRDWPAFCRKATTDYDKLIKSSSKQVKELSSHGPFKAILELPNPMIALRLGKAGLDGEIAGLRPGTHAWAIALRDRAAWVIDSASGLRIKTLQELDWEPDERGQLRLGSDAIGLFIPASAFKNELGPAFNYDGKQWDYTKKLRDNDGAFEAVRIYIEEGRPILLKGQKTDAVFISNIGGHRLGRSPMARCIAATYNRHVRWNEEAQTGIRGAKAVNGAHWMRAVLATAVLKITGKEQLAADAIHDSVGTIRKYYVRYVAKDREAELDAALDRGYLDE